MLLRPDLSDATIFTALRDHFGLTARSIEFLPLGYDSNAGVYRVVVDDGTTYFLKARRGAPNEIGVSSQQLGELRVVFRDEAHDDLADLRRSAHAAEVVLVALEHDLQ